MLIPSLVILFYFIKFNLYFFKIYLFSFDHIFSWICFFNSIPNYFGWLRFWHYDFFKFTFYGAIRPHNLCRRLWRLYRVWHFRSFKLFIFKFHPSTFNIKLVGDWLSLFFLNFSFYDVFSILCHSSWTLQIHQGWLEFFFLIFFKYYFFNFVLQY